MRNTRRDPVSVRAYDGERAARYDAHSDLVWDGRERQRAALGDVLACMDRAPRRFVDLGCGTGFFTEAIFEVFPRARGIGIDGSEAMLGKARERFHGSKYRLVLQREFLEAIDWASLGAVDLAFSGLALHHLADRAKAAVLRRVSDALTPGGFFVLIDSFRPADPDADRIVEALSCIKIQRAVQARRGSAPPLQQIIGRDREAKLAEGDREASIEAHLRWLRRMGFRGVTPVFQDDRIAGIVAIKPA